MWWEKKKGRICRVKRCENPAYACRLCALHYIQDRPLDYGSATGSVTGRATKLGRSNKARKNHNNRKVK